MNESMASSLLNPSSSGVSALSLPIASSRDTRKTERLSSKKRNFSPEIKRIAFHLLEQLKVIACSLLLETKNAQELSFVFCAVCNGRNRPTACEARRLRALLGEGRLSLNPFANDAEVVEKEEEDLNFLDRLALAWQILFPVRKKAASNAEIAKQRLKMILISDRCCVNDDAKKQIVTNIVGALSDFVEIESEDRVRLNVSADPDLGTVYSVSVPVRRVRPEFQESSNEMRNTELQDDVVEPLNTVEALIDLPESQDLQVDT